MSRYKLSKEQVKRIKPLVETFIDRLENAEHPEDNFYEVVEDFSNSGINPRQLVELLKDMGYEEIDLALNSSVCDYWLTMSKDGYRDILVRGQGDIFELLLSGNYN